MTADSKINHALLQEGNELALAAIAFAQKVIATTPSDQPENAVAHIGLCRLMDGFNRLTLLLTNGWRE